MSTGSIGGRCRGFFERVSGNRATFLVLGSADPCTSRPNRSRDGSPVMHLIRSGWTRPARLPR